MGLRRACLAAIGLAAFNPVALAQTGADEGWPLGERLLGKFKAGKYAEVVAEGPAGLKAEPWNQELRLALANSLLWTGHEWTAVETFRVLLGTELDAEARLGMANGLAWTGRMAQAVPHYQALRDGPKAGEAKLGLGNALLWMGRADLSMPLFQQLRAAYPGQDIGVEGEFYSRRALRARTVVGTAYSQDNAPTRRHEPIMSHAWRDSSKAVLFGLETTGGRDWNDDLDLSRREFAFRIESLDSWLAPRLSVSRQSAPQGRTFADLRVEATQWPLYVNVGRVNWGKLSFTLPALDLGLTADRYGLEGRYQVAAGELRGYANHFDISDGNRMENGDVRLTSRWRPWGPELRPFVGTHWRLSGRTDPNYWSPKTYVLGYVGIEGVWESRYWSVTAIGQVGFKLAGEASTSWTASLIAKRWIGDDWAIGLNGYAQSGTREAKYRAEGVSLLVEKLW